MKKSSVYTKTGDQGLTGLVGGTRIKKSDPRIHLYGEVDELNAILGLAISFLSSDFDKNFLLNIQSALFDIGSNLACEKDKRAQFKLPQIPASLITEMELEIDKLDSNLPTLKHFVMPGGSKDAAFFHVARTVCRRVERQLVDFENLNPGETPVNANQFLNRLSDYFFILSRSLNANASIEEIKWIPST